MRVTVRNGQEVDAPASEIMIDAFGLAVVFSTLQESAHSRVYNYEGVQFWRANNMFVIAYGGESFTVPEAITLEAFHALLCRQKAS